MIRNYDIEFTYFDEKTGIDAEIYATFVHMPDTHDEPGEWTMDDYFASFSGGDAFSDDEIDQVMDRAHSYTNENMHKLIRESLVDQY
jgi:hypothetical protein